MTDWLEWHGDNWHEHTENTVCPCPAKMKVDVRYQVGSSPGNALITTKWNDVVSGFADEIYWSYVTRWRPDPDKYECKFNGNLLVAYRMKESQHD